MKYLCPPLDFLVRLARSQAMGLLLGLALITLNIRPASADRSIFRQFTGVGLKGDYYSNSEGADVSLGIAARSGTLGVIGLGGVGSVNYRFNSHLISGHAGFDTYILALGLQLALAWQVDRQEGGADLGGQLWLKTQTRIYSSSHVFNDRWAELYGGSYRIFHQLFDLHLFR